MGILESAVPAIVICTRDRPRAAAFYGETLGLRTAGGNGLAAVFETGGVTLRISTVADFIPHGHTILGFRVIDVAGTVRALAAAGVAFKRIPGLAQDEFGVLIAPGGVHVAWFEDPDGNVLSVTDV